MFNVPITLIVYKRPEHTAQVINSFRALKPKKIYVIADGPKNIEDKQKVKNTRSVIQQSIDWKCEINKNYSLKNMGLKHRVVSGLDWVFKQESKSIVLEDDCVPDLTFFNFCQELLERYDKNKQIMSISGDNFLFDKVKTSNSYYFSKYHHCWGWATWQRAWKLYDPDLIDWPKLKITPLLKNLFPNLLGRYYWHLIFDALYKQKINTWDYQWNYMQWKHNGVSIIPHRNLVRNIGFSLTDATHTKKISKFANIPIYPISFPLVHPKVINANTQADNYVTNNMFLTLNNISGAILSWLK